MCVCVCTCVYVRACVPTYARAYVRVCVGGTHREIQILRQRDRQTDRGWGGGGKRERKPDCNYMLSTPSPIDSRRSVLIYTLNNGPINLAVWQQSGGNLEPDCESLRVMYSGHQSWRPITGPIPGPPLSSHTALAACSLLATSRIRSFDGHLGGGF